jgi:hypothetical protein
MENKQELNNEEQSGGFKELQDYLRKQGAEARGKDSEARRQFLAEDAVLVNVQAIFDTQDEGKDVDTWLECWINKAGDVEAAHTSTYGIFEEYHSNVLYLAPKGSIMKKTEVAGSWFQIRIRPNGNDTWRFKCEVTLHFSDGSIHFKKFLDPTTLDQVSRQSNKYL